MQYIQLQPQIASQVPTAPNGSLNFFLDAETNNVATKNDTGEITSGGTSGGASLVSIRYSGLTNLITTSGLTPNTSYLITDFRTCYDQPDFNVNKNAITNGNYKQAAIEPIFVLATSNSTISPDAYQPFYPNDKIKYDWTFSATEVTDNVAYGRITERIDEFNNRTDYDHRTILFKRYQYIEMNVDNSIEGSFSIVPQSSTEMNVVGINTTFTSLSVGQYIGFKEDDFKAYEIVAISGDTEMSITGLTPTNLNTPKAYIGTSRNNTLYYSNNITTAYTEHHTFDYGNTNLNNYIGDYANSYYYNENSFILANNVFQNSSYINNTFGDSCYNNSFYANCENNIIGNYFYSNNTDDDFDGNVISNYFNDNRITANFRYNRIGEGFNNNYIYQNNFYRNNIMNSFNNNVISRDFQNNEIGNQFGSNVIKNGDFYKNDIGNGYNNNQIYSEFYGNLIGNGYAYNEINSRFYDNVIGEYFNDNSIGDILNPFNYDFNGNKIGNQFNNNTILNDFADNTMGDEFKGNLILQDFSLNNIKSYVGANEFSGSTYNNNIGSYTYENSFLGEVIGNTWGVWFNANNIGLNFYDNNIMNGFGSNSISNDFRNNYIQNNFRDNVIGDGFGFGNSEPQGNKIGNNFYNNTINEYFYNNSISDNFFDNTITNNFQWNIVNTSIDGTDFTVNYGNITGFTPSANGSSASDNTYTNIGGTTNGLGVNATFDINVENGSVITVNINNIGKFYVTSDTLTILGEQIGGITPDDNIVITVTGVSVKPSVYEPYTCQIFERQGGNKRLSFYDENDILTINNINE